MIKKRISICSFVLFFLLFGVIFRGFTVSNEVFADSDAVEGRSFSDFTKTVSVEELNSDVLYKLWDSVTLFESGRDSAQSYIYRFDVSSDGKSVALGFTDGEGSSVTVFSLTTDGLVFDYGFDISLSEAFEICFADEGVAVWLRESNVVFAFGRDDEILEPKRLVLNDENAEDTVKSPNLEKAESFFGCGRIEKSTLSGEVFRLASAVGDGDGVQYFRLVKVSSDGSETVVYEAVAVDGIASVVTVCIGVSAVILALSTVCLLVFGFVKRKK